MVTCPFYFLMGLPVPTCWPTQCLFSLATRGESQITSITPLLKAPPWLPIVLRIKVEALIMSSNACMAGPCLMHLPVLHSLDLNHRSQPHLSLRKLEGQMLEKDLDLLRTLGKLPHYTSSLQHHFRNQNKQFGNKCPSKHPDGMNNYSLFIPQTISSRGCCCFFKLFSPHH